MSPYTDEQYAGMFDHAVGLQSGQLPRRVASEAWPWPPTEPWQMQALKT